MTELLRAEQLGHFYQDGSLRTQVLSQQSFQIAPGEFVGLRGPSGSGKSTLLNILGLVLLPSQGSYFFEGQNTNTLTECERAAIRRIKMGFVFQHFCLLQGLTAIENVQVTALLSGRSKAEARQRSAELLNQAGLSRQVNQMPGTLSGGEQQRVAVCRALIHQPKLLLADEPTGSLDAESSRIVLEMLEGARKQGVAVLMASHSDRALRACSRVLELSQIENPRSMHA